MIPITIDLVEREDDDEDDEGLSLLVDPDAEDADTEMDTVLIETRQIGS